MNFTDFSKSAYVTIADLNEERGKELVQELSP